jgi:hypothetical protein
MSDHADIEAYLAEGTSLIGRAEECTSCLRRNGACEGQLLVAATTLIAMHQIDLLLKAHRDRLIVETASAPTAPPMPGKRRWWPPLRSKRACNPISLR